jgi:hypothetical protein
VRWPEKGFFFAKLLSLTLAHKEKSGRFAQDSTAILTI